MSDTSIAIKVAGDETKAHAAAITSDDAAWVKGLSESGKPVQIRMPADADTEGHELSSVLTVLVGGDDDDDVEGHALSLHFPSVQEANDFRRNLIAAGLITATLAVGAAGGMAIGQATSGIGSGEAVIATEGVVTNLGQYDPTNMGGTVAAIQGASSLGQADSANLGGTIVQGASSLGQADPANMGGTIASVQGASSLGQADSANLGGTIVQGASSLGQADPANMGGTIASVQGASSLGQADPANPGGTIVQGASSLGQADPANPGGTPQSNADDEDVDGPTLPPGI